VEARETPFLGPALLGTAPLAINEAGRKMAMRKLGRGSQRDNNGAGGGGSKNKKVGAFLPVLFAKEQI